MIDDRDFHPAPVLDGFGSATTLNPLPPSKRRRKMGRIGFKTPKPTKPRSE